MIIISFHVYKQFGLNDFGYNAKKPIFPDNDQGSCSCLLLKLALVNRNKMLTKVRTAEMCDEISNISSSFCPQFANFTVFLILHEWK